MLQVYHRGCSKSSKGKKRKEKQIYQPNIEMQQLQKSIGQIPSQNMNVLICHTFVHQINYLHIVIFGKAIDFLSYTQSSVSILFQ